MMVSGFVRRVVQRRAVDCDTLPTARDDDDDVARGTALDTVAAGQRCTKQVWRALAFAQCQLESHRTPFKHSPAYG
jgi:hypothetical protein